jgi:DNA (cytosine-5)-methyltransferase 1
MVAYYNEHDPYAAQWLRNLINAGHIATGIVDERDIRDVKPSNLEGFTQCHFFAGIGVWSHALRTAGWSDQKPVWTASCPCQPFSAAGAGDGFDDERHLWPALQWLIEQCRPETIFGEQVASKDGLGWLDLVSTDLEATDYAIGAIDTCAAGFGAYHIRQRLYFAAYDTRAETMGMADASSRGRREQRHEAHARDSGHHDSSHQPGRLAHADGQGCDIWTRLCDELEKRRWSKPADPSQPQWVGDTECARLEGHGRDGNRAQGWPVQDRSGTAAGIHGGLADTDESKRPRIPNSQGSIHDRPKAGRDQSHSQPEPSSKAGRPSAPDLGRAPADWLYCRDGKWRPVEPGTFPLAYGLASRMGRLRGYGNSLDARQATGFIRAYMERDMVDLQATPAGDLFEWAT